MVEVVVIVEGETEQTFVQRQLAAHLGLLGMAIWAVLPGRNRRTGGVKPWAVARQDIMRTLRERRYCTTMFDYYGMPSDWPGRTEAREKPSQERALHVESAMLNDIARGMGDNFDPRWFVPYVQLHEFEALVFADVQQLVSVAAPLSDHSSDRLLEEFQRIVVDAGDPEAINDGYETCPSRRIQRQVNAYRKRTHGPIITERAGLPRLRESCVHFGSWLTRLETLGRVG